MKARKMPIQSDSASSIFGRQFMTPLLEWIKVFAAIFALSSGIYGAVQAYSIIPIMQKQQQAEIDVIKGDFRQTHERLARIESNIEWIRSTLDRNKITKNDPSMVSQ